ncbi:MAG TPA: RNA polymerase sigma factor SigJ [Micromonosporaceae bacterium]|nr:RNA polymerase sigma factor SigJ [Micromonosporaceae bacterium]
MQELAAEFEAERGHLTAVAYRMLGSRTEAEDAVQETWLRCAAALGGPGDRAEIRDLRAWLTTIVGRICLDLLRSARVRRETYPGIWLPEPLVSTVPGRPAGAVGGGRFAPDPADRVASADKLGAALLVVLERLTPEQRVAFVLHDVFSVPFEQIAAVLSTTTTAARQLASRARKAVTDGAPRHRADLAEQRRVLAAFLAAAEAGDLDRLVTVLAPDVVFTGDGGGHFPATRRPVEGADKVARFTIGIFHRAPQEVAGAHGRAVLVDGAVGLQVEAVYRDGRPFRLVMWFTIAEGRVTAIFNQLNPDKLRHVPTLEPADADWPPRL